MPVGSALPWLLLRSLRSPDPASNAWARVADRYKLAEKLIHHPGLILFGEIFGNNTDMPYGVRQDITGSDFLVFDAYSSGCGRFVDHAYLEDICEVLGLPMVPVLKRLVWGKDSFESLLPLAEGNTTLDADHVREGFVVKSAIEPHIGRIILKMAGEGYYTRKGA